MSKRPLAIRLTPQQTAAIQKAAKACWPPHTTVRLFGSPLDSARRGGDIDLLVETPDAQTPADLVDRRNRFVARLYRLLGEQRIDVVFAATGVDDPRPVLAVDRGKGQLLVEVPP